MELGHYIDELIKLRQTHGADLQVMTNGGYGPAKKAPLPRTTHLSTEHPKTFFVNGRDPDRDKGAKVVRV